MRYGASCCGIVYHWQSEPSTGERVEVPVELIVCFQCGRLLEYRHAYIRIPETRIVLRKEKPLGKYRIVDFSRRTGKMRRR